MLGKSILHIKLYLYINSCNPPHERKGTYKKCNLMGSRTTLRQGIHSLLKKYLLIKAYRTISTYLWHVFTEDGCKAS